MKTRQLVLVIALVSVIAVSTPRAGGCIGWQEGPLRTDPQYNGTNGGVWSSVVWDPDPDGFTLPRLVIAGALMDAIEGVEVNSIAMLDPATNEWDPLGGGPGFEVTAVTTFDGDLLAGGGEGALGTEIGRVARWNGVSWEAVGGEFDHYVECLAEYNGQLIAGGLFTSVGSRSASGVAAWNGASWEPLGAGCSDAVRALTVYNSELIAGGDFMSAGDEPANRLARWNGSTWQRFGTGVSGLTVSALGVYAGELIVGGDFSAIDGVPLSKIGRWNGSLWRSLGSGVGGGDVLCVAYDTGTLVVGGRFSTAGGISVNYLARWNGSSWQSIGSGIGSPPALVSTATAYSGELVVGGAFTTAGGQTARNIARWTGTQWTAFGGGSATIVSALERFRQRLVGAGIFDQPTSTSQRAFNIVGWNGAVLQPFGTGMNDWVLALESFQYSPVVTYELIAGGTFTTAGGVAANRIARWQETNVTVPAWQPMGAGFNNWVSAIKRWNGATYAAGGFTLSSSTTVNRIARWNESADTWEPLGTGINNSVYALEEYNGALYAGGAFTTAGGVSTGGLAQWNGSSWSAVGGFFNGAVYSLAVHDGELIVGGDHTEVAGSPDIVKWNGSTFTGIGNGGSNAAVYSLVSSASILYAGGNFSTMGGVSTRRLARWDGSAWSDNGGTDGTVQALAFFNGQTHAGGSFSSVNDPAIPSPCWGRYHETDQPWIVNPPTFRTVDQGEPAYFTVLPADGYEPLSYQWFRNGSPLVDGETGTGSHILGAATDELQLDNVSYYDQGAYSVIVSNAFGADTSSNATLTVIGPTDVPTADLPEGEAIAASSIESAWPNPTRGPTSIALRLAHESDVSVKLYDVSGRLVRHLPMGRLPAGRREAVWDGRGQHDEPLSAGVYVLSLESDGRPRDTRRLVLLR